jgi:hypothetical protein
MLIELTEFVGTYVGGKLLDWAIPRDIEILAGTEKERATRRAFQEAAIEALKVACDESVAPVDEESAEALAEHLATSLTDPYVAEMLFRAANANTVPDADLGAERMSRSGLDESIFPFDIEDFITAFVPRLGDVVGREIRSQGMTEHAFADKLDELLTWAEPRGSAIRAALTEEDGPRRRPVLVGIRSFTRRAEDMDDEMDALLRLERHFEGRHIRATEHWSTAVYPELETFLGRNLNGHDRYLLHLSTHTSIAFACGFLLDPKSGVDVVPVQRTSGRKEWRPALDPSVLRRGLPDELWDCCTTPLHEGGRDLVVGVSATLDVLEDVRAYAGNSIPTAGRVLHFEVRPSASRHSVRDGTHALLLAEELLARVRKERNPKELSGSIHLFASAPVGLMFFAGRLSRGLGPCALYEYDFEGGGLGAYTPSLVLPPPAEGSTGEIKTRGG